MFIGQCYHRKQLKRLIIFHQNSLTKLKIRKKPHTAAVQHCKHRLLYNPNDVCFLASQQNICLEKEFVDRGRRFFFPSQVAVLSATIKIHLLSFFGHFNGFVFPRSFSTKKLWVSDQLPVQISPIFRQQHVFAQSYKWTLNLQRCNGIMSGNSIIWELQLFHGGRKEKNNAITSPNVSTVCVNQNLKTEKEERESGVLFFSSFIPLSSSSPTFNLLLPPQLSICCVFAWAWIPIVSSWNRNKGCCPSSCSLPPLLPPHTGLEKSPLGRGPHLWTTYHNS